MKAFTKIFINQVLSQSMSLDVTVFMPLATAIPIHIPNAIVADHLT